jgi:hypothetical protein
MTPSLRAHTSVISTSEEISDKYVKSIGLSSLPVVPQLQLAG